VHWRKAGLADLPDLEQFLMRNEVQCVGFSAWLREKITSTPHLRNDFTVYIRRDKNHETGAEAIDEAVLITEQGLVYPIITRRPPGHDHGVHELYHQFRREPPPASSIIGVARSVDMIANLLRRPVRAKVDYHLMYLDRLPADVRCAPLKRDVKIRRATISDVVALYDLQRRYEIEEVCLNPGQFNETACYAHLKDSLRKEIIFMAERAGRPLAKAGTNACGYRVWQIGGVYTRPEERGQGLGAWLMKSVIDAARKNDRATCLFVKKNNRAAIALYEKLGYETIDSFRITYFRNGC
jgi:ribosomal protein S18 acetylase RimI-like enzyme